MRSRFIVCLVLLVLVVGFCLPLVRGDVVGGGSIDSGLVGYWRLDGDTLDSSGSGNDGALVNSPVYYTGKYVESLSFGGVSGQGVDIAGNTVLGDDAFTLSCWVNFSQQGVWEFPVCFGSVGDNTNYVAIAGHGGSDKVCGIAEGETVDSLVTVNSLIGVWHMVSLTYSGGSEGNLTLFVDGVYQNLLVCTPNVLTDSVCIGNYFLSQNSFLGMVDDVRIYNRVLSGVELSVLYNGYFVSVSHDIGSTVSPDVFTNVGVDQDVSFSCGVTSTNFMLSSFFVDGVASAPVATYDFGGVQGNHTLYVTSQFVGTTTVANVSDMSGLYGVIVEVVMIVLCLLVVGWLKGVPLVVFFFGLFTAFVGAYVALAGAWLVSGLFGLLSVFTVVIGIFVMFSSVFPLRWRVKR